MKKALIFLLIVFAVGCQKKYVKAPSEPVKTESAAPAEVKAAADKKGAAEEKIYPKSAEIKRDVLEKKEEVAAKEESVFKDALFDFDKYDIRADARPVLEGIALWLKKNKDVNIVIEGHCDERGTNEYNLALGEKRAKAAKDFLSALGISASRAKTISYGEEKPLCSEQREECYQRNRRAHTTLQR
ncbi:MAG: peptidoglycan-associated lipoprotein Pal [Nitrospirae bacterium]|nr:peptidoglycan-associated lipoprotein Pal [Nitrospirota bacterium]